MKKVIFTTGRMNPPTKGHEKLISQVKQLAKEQGCDYRFYITRSQDSKKNPLSVEQKKHFLTTLFPGVQFHDCQNAFTACKEMAELGYESAILVVGEDRDGELVEGLKKYISPTDPTKAIGLKAIDAMIVERPEGDYSATEARNHAVLGNIEEFSKCIPEADPSVVAELYHAVRQGLGVEQWQDSTSKQRQQN